MENSLVMFVMKDQDLLSKNDYMAEAFVRLSEATSADSAPYPKQIHLKLNRPRNSGTCQLQVNYEDLLAKDTVKKKLFARIE